MVQKRQKVDTISNTELWEFRTGLIKRPMKWREVGPQRTCCRALGKEWHFRVSSAKLTFRRAHSGQWEWHRCSPLSPALSPAGRSESSPEVPSAGPGTPAGWVPNSWSCLPAPQHWCSPSTCTGPPQSPRGTGGGPGWCCRGSGQKQMVRQGKGR